MKLTVLLAVVALAASGEALKCYVCQSAEVGGFDISSVLSKVLTAPSCDDFDPSNPDKKFEMECGSLEKGCTKLVDPDNAKNQARGCVLVGKNECKDKSCTCTDDLCNGAGYRWPSAVLVLIALAATLVGGR